MTGQTSEQLSPKRSEKPASSGNLQVTAASVPGGVISNKPVPQTVELTNSRVRRAVRGVHPEHGANTVDAGSPADPDADVTTHDILQGCKAWLSSMVLHLIAILVLALFTMNAPVSRTVSLTMGTDENSALDSLDDLTFDLTGYESFDEPEAIPTEIPEELLSIDSTVDFQTHEDASNIKGFMAEDSLHQQTTGGLRSASFFGLEARGDKIVYIVDRSGSMRGYRWRQASQELVSSIEQLKPDQKFFVYLFSEGAHPMPRLGGRGNLVSATKQNIADVKKWILRQSPDKNTFPLSSVKQALRQQPDTIFLLTDGKFHDETGQYLVQRAEMRKNTSDPEDVVIHTIAFHVNDFHLLLMLRDIAVSYSGSFRHVE